MIISQLYLRPLSWIFHFVLVCAIPIIYFQLTYPFCIVYVTISFFESFLEKNERMLPFLLHCFPKSALTKYHKQCSLKFILSILEARSPKSNAERAMFSLEALEMNPPLSPQLLVVVGNRWCSWLVAEPLQFLPMFTWPFSLCVCL